MKYKLISAAVLAAVLTGCSSTKEFQKAELNEVPKCFDEKPKDTETRVCRVAEGNADDLEQAKIKAVTSALGEISVVVAGKTSRYVLQLSEDNQRGGASPTSKQTKIKTETRSREVSLPYTEDERQTFFLKGNRYRFFVKLCVDPSTIPTTNEFTAADGQALNAGMQ